MSQRIGSSGGCGITSEGVRMAVS